KPGGQAFESPAFGDTRRQEVDDREIPGRVLRPHCLAEIAPTAGFQGLFGLTHSFYPASHHPLDWIVPVSERILAGADNFNGVPIGFDPQCDPLVRLLKILKDQFSTANHIKGEYRCSKRPQQSAQFAGDARLKVRSIDRIAPQGSCHCSIGRDERHIRSESEAFEQGSGVSSLAARSNGDRNSGALCGPEGLSVSGANGLAEGRQQGAVHVDRHKANGGMHVSSLIVSSSVMWFPPCRMGLRLRWRTLP